MDSGANVRLAALVPSAQSRLRTITRFFRGFHSHRYDSAHAPQTCLRFLLSPYFQISSKGEDKGKVYFWDSVEEEDVDEEAGEEPGYSNVYLLANSFQEFINSLEKIEDDS